MFFSFNALSAQTRRSYRPSSAVHAGRGQRFQLGNSLLFSVAIASMTASMSASRSWNEAKSKFHNLYLIPKEYSNNFSGLFSSRFRSDRRSSGQSGKTGLKFLIRKNDIILKRVSLKMKTVKP